MGGVESEWSGEEIAAVDATFKRMENAHDVAMALDRIFFANDEKEAGSKLKASAHALTALVAEIPAEAQAKWRAALIRQLKTSVARVKKSGGKN